MKAKLLVLIIALLGMIVPGVPMITATTPVHAATNNLVIGYYNGMTTVAAKYNVSVYLNNPVVVKQDTKTISGTNYFVINFSQITIQAGEVTMYLSTNGYSQISNSDVQLYSLPTSLINSSKISTVTVTASNGQKLTLTVGEKAIIGAIPLVAVPQGLYYVKAYFGSTAPVATSIAEVNVLPTISISPTSGPAGQTVTVNGYAFSSSGIVNLAISYSVLGKSYKNSVNITASSTGTFTYTFTAPELKLETSTSLTNVLIKNLPKGNITVTAHDYMSGYSNSQIYTEYGRAFYQIKEYNPTTASWETIIPNSKGEVALNGTVTNVAFYETEPMIISGIYFAPNSQVTLTFGSITLGTFTTNASGFFNATVSVPVVGRGTYSVIASDPLAHIYFNGTPVTEVVVSPTKFTTGSTVTVSGYAFDPNTYANVTWVGLFINSTGAYGESYLAVNVPVGSNGVFSASVSIPMPTFGGIHYIYVNDTKGANAFANITVVPTISLSTSTAPLGSQVKVSLNGLDVGIEKGNMKGFTSDYFGAASEAYELAYDNIPTYITGESGNNYGAASASITAAGYPMLHAVQLVGNGLIATAWLNVTGTTNTEAGTVAAIESLNTSVSSLSNTISSDYSSLSSMLSSLNASVTGISNSVSSLSGTLTTQYSSIMSSLASISTLISDLKSTISSDYSSLSSAISSLSSTVSTISSSSSSISSSVTSIGTSVSSLQSAVSSLQSTVSSLSTYLLVVAVLAIIIIVLELVLLVRKK